MSPRTSSARKIWNLISRNGIRGGFRKASNIWARHQLAAPHDVLSEYGFVLEENSPAKLEAPRNGPLRINWIVPAFGRGDGGMFNILRAVHRLEQWGHTNRIYMVGPPPEGGGSATEVAHSYFPIKTKVESFGREIADSDALIATFWPTAYAARSVGNTARKFYIVQDVEPLFYASGSLTEFARETYRWGFYGITAGKWIADVLRSEFNMECTAFRFSYDRESYSPYGPKLLPKGRRRVLFYARPATERRGFELGILALSLVARKMPDIEFVLAGLRPRSIELPFRFNIPGVLSPNELGSLYRSCDAALVLSHTNLSLLPLELMASGCAVVSNSGPNVEWLLTDEVARLSPPVPQALADAILALLQDDALRYRQVNSALAFAQSTDWLPEIRSIESALYNGLGILSEATHE
jgi:glycosyltransferase involved in cell wall biosynthesis